MIKRLMEEHLSHLDKFSSWCCGIRQQPDEYTLPWKYVPWQRGINRSQGINGSFFAIWSPTTFWRITWEILSLKRYVSNFTVLLLASGQARKSWWTLLFVAVKYSVVHLYTISISFHAGSMIWLDTSNITYTKWYQDPPSIFASSCGYILKNTDYQWGVTENCSQEFDFICEFGKKWNPHPCL